MIRFASPSSCVAFLCAFFFLSHQASAAGDVKIVSQVRFSVLDGGALDLDGVDDGVFTVETLQIIGNGTLLVDVADATIRASGTVRRYERKAFVRRWTETK